MDLVKEHVQRAGVAEVDAGVSTSFLSDYLPVFSPPCISPILLLGPQLNSFFTRT